MNKSIQLTIGIFFAVLFSLLQNSLGQIELSQKHKELIESLPKKEQFEVEYTVKDIFKDEKLDLEYRYEFFCQLLLLEADFELKLARKKIEDAKKNKIESEFEIIDSPLDTLESWFLDGKFVNGALDYGFQSNRPKLHYAILGPFFTWTGIHAHIDKVKSLLEHKELTYRYRAARLCTQIQALRKLGSEKIIEWIKSEPDLLLIGRPDAILSTDQVLRVLNDAEVPVETRLKVIDSWNLYSETHPGFRKMLNDSDARVRHWGSLFCMKHLNEYHLKILEQASQSKENEFLARFAQQLHYPENQTDEVKQFVKKLLIKLAKHTNKSVVYHASAKLSRFPMSKEEIKNAKQGLNNEETLKQSLGVLSQNDFLPKDVLAKLKSLLHQPKLEESNRKTIINCLVLNETPTEFWLQTAQKKDLPGPLRFDAMRFASNDLEIDYTKVQLESIRELMADEDQKVARMAGLMLAYRREFDERVQKKFVESLLLGNHYAEMGLFNKALQSLGNRTRRVKKAIINLELKYDSQKLGRLGEFISICFEDDPELLAYYFDQGFKLFVTKNEFKIHRKLFDHPHLSNQIIRFLKGTQTQKMVAEDWIQFSRIPNKKTYVPHLQDLLKNKELSKYDRESLEDLIESIKSVESGSSRAKKEFVWFDPKSKFWDLEQIKDKKLSAEQIEQLTDRIFLVNALGSTSFAEDALEILGQQGASARHVRPKLQKLTMTLRWFHATVALLRIGGQSEDERRMLERSLFDRSNLQHKFKARKLPGLLPRLFEQWLVENISELKTKQLEFFDVLLSEWTPFSDEGLELVGSHLIEIIANPKEPVELRRVALERLGELVSPEQRFGEKALIQLWLKDNELPIKDSKRQVLDYFLFRKMQFGSDPLRVLIKMRSKPALEQLILMLDEPEKFGKTALAISKYENDGQSAAPTLRRHLKNPNHAELAAYALSWIGEPVESVLPAIIDGLKKFDMESIHPQLGFIRAAQNYGPEAKQALPLLKKLKQDVGFGVANAIDEAIKEIEKK